MFEITQFVCFGNQTKVAYDGDLYGHAVGVVQDGGRAS